MTVYRVSVICPGRGVTDRPMMGVTDPGWALQCGYYKDRVGVTDPDWDVTP